VFDEIAWRWSHMRTETCSNYQLKPMWAARLVYFYLLLRWGSNTTNEAEAISMKFCMYIMAQNGVLHESLPSVCLSVCIFLLSLQSNGSVKTFPRQRRIVGTVVLYAVPVVSKESRRLVLPRTCFILPLMVPGNQIFEFVFMCPVLYICICIFQYVLLPF
jgi:hypothetical protein